VQLTLTHPPLQFPFPGKLQVCPAGGGVVGVVGMSGGVGGTGGEQAASFVNASWFLGIDPPLQ
jgi:hypothetical protein